jgi:hypothetical protein
MIAGSARRAGVDGRRRSSTRIRRLLGLAVVLSLLVVAINSVVTSSAKGPDPAITFADEVRPAVDRSTRQAAALEDLRAQAGALGRDGLVRGVDRLVRESEAAVGIVEKTEVNSKLRDARGLLLTCLTTRSKSLKALAATLAGEFEGGPPEQAVDALVRVGRDLAVSDRAYELFLDELSSAARKTMPASTWLPDETKFARPEMAAFVSTLRAAASLAPVHDLSLITVTVDPAPVGTDGTARVLPVSKTMKLQVVVANAGNGVEKRVAVEAVVASTGGMDTARQFVDLAPGQRATVALTLRPSPVGVLDLKVRAVPVNGEASVADNEQASHYVMR